jgi:hypothetical protein
VKYRTPSICNGVPAIRMAGVPCGRLMRYIHARLSAPTFVAEIFVSGLNRRPE